MRRVPFSCALHATHQPSRNHSRSLTSIFVSSFSIPRHRPQQRHQHQHWRHLSHSDPVFRPDLISPIPSPKNADMARLNPTSLAAINRLRSFKPPPTSYDLVPLERRAAVLLLLYADGNGDLRVVLTIRASTLSSYAGQAALPGGKADSLSETPLATSRREASEEIGLPNLNSPLPSPFSVEHLCEIPCSLARTELVVRPVVALLHSHDEKTGKDAEPETELIPRLDAREVAAVFTADFKDFLIREPIRVVDGEGKGDEEWYRGVWTEWWGTRWRMHQFHVPIQPQKVIKPKAHDTSQQESIEALEKQEQKQRQTRSQTRKQHSSSTTSSGQVQGDEKGKYAEQEQTRYRVFGMTARILVDVARIAYDTQPEFEHNGHAGDEELIRVLRGRGRLGPKARNNL